MDRRNTYAYCITYYTYYRVLNKTNTYRYSNVSFSVFPFPSALSNHLLPRAMIPLRLDRCSQCPCRSAPSLAPFQTAPRWWRPPRWRCGAALGAAALGVARRPAWEASLRLVDEVNRLRACQLGSRLQWVWCSNVPLLAANQFVCWQNSVIMIWMFDEFLFCKLL